MGGPADLNVGFEVRSVQVQVVLRNNDRVGVQRSLASLAASLQYASRFRVLRMRLRYGDVGDTATLSDEDLATLRSRYDDLLQIDYLRFESNTTYGRCNNELANLSSEDLLLLLDPEVTVDPRALGFLINECERPGTGAVDAKQIPFENPIDYDRETGETSWASRVCLAIPHAVFSRLGGFDSESFSIGCEDVDLSWRVREQNLAVVHQPAAVVFRDQRIEVTATRQRSKDEIIHSTLSSLILAYKWSRQDLIESRIEELQAQEDAYLDEAISLFREREATDALPKQTDLSNSIGHFEGWSFAPLRYEMIKVMPGGVSQLSWKNPAKPDGALASENVTHDECPAPFLSVVMRTQGRRLQALREALTGLSAQTFTDFEVLLVGHDLNEKIAHEIEDLIGDYYSGFSRRVELLQISGGGRSAPLNLGFSEARGAYIAMLDDDDVPMAHWIETFADLQRGNPGRMLRANVAVQQTTVARIHGLEAVRASGGLLLPFPSVFRLAEHLNDNHTPNMAVAVPRDTLEIHGLAFDETLSTHEDWEFITRAASLLGVASSPEYTALYRWWEGVESSRTVQTDADREANIAQIHRRHEDQGVLFTGTELVNLRNAMNKLSELMDSAEQREAKLEDEWRHAAEQREAKLEDEWRHTLESLEQDLVNRIETRTHLLLQIDAILRSRKHKAMAPLRRLRNIVVGGGKPITLSDCLPLSNKRLTEVLTQLRARRHLL